MDSLIYLVVKKLRYLSNLVTPLIGRLNKWNSEKLDKYLDMGKPIITVGLIVFVSVFLGRGIYNTYRLENEGVYTTGVIDSYGKGARGSKAVIYSFYVSGKKYIGETLYDARTNAQVGDNYSVIYLPENPTLNDMKFR